MLCLTSGCAGLLALLHGGLCQEERRCLAAKEPLIVLDEDLDGGGDLLGVALPGHHLHLLRELDTFRKGIKSSQSFFIAVGQSNQIFKFFGLKWQWHANFMYF